MKVEQWDGGGGGECLCLISFHQGMLVGRDLGRGYGKLFKAL